MRIRSSIALLLLAITASLGQTTAPSTKPAEESEFGKTADGTTVKLFTLRNAKGMTAKISSYGAIITSLQTPDRDGKMAGVILGADTFAQYLRGFNLHAQTVGRVANRIAGAKFTLDGKEYTTEANNGPNTLHSGRADFGTHVWEGKIPDPAKPSVQLTYISKDGDGGFPGTLTAKVTFSLTDNNEFRLDYEAVTDKPTPVNLTNHAYFNLAGTGNVLNHEVWIDADKYTVTNDQLIPTGEIAPVKDKAWDFTKPTAVGARVAELGGRAPTYDHSFVLNSGGKSFALVARVSEPTSGRIMEVKTDQPGLQFYTGDARHPGLCLETQHFPDSVHHDNFPTTILRPGETFKASTIYAFSRKSFQPRRPCHGKLFCRMSIHRYKFFRPNQAARLRRLELTVRGVVEGVFAGLHKSPHKGFSIEFAEHREYVPGDELKHLDWTVLARTDRYYIKQYEQETNLRATICLDASGSMAFGKAAVKPPKGKKPQLQTPSPSGTSKFEYAAVLAASLAFMLSNQQDLVGLTVFDKDIITELPQGNGPSHLDQLFKRLEHVKPAKETDVAQALHQLANKIPRRGLVILISDLLDDPDRILLALQHLKHARHQMIVLQVLDRAETDLTFTQPVTFEDMEDQSRLAIDPKLIREDYRREMSAFLDSLKLRCAQFRIDYLLAYTDIPWETQIREVLRRTRA